MEQLTTLIPLIIIIIAFYFLFFRPTQQQAKKKREMQDSLKVGDEILTIGGFYGIVYAFDEKNVVIELLPDFNKAMIVREAIGKIILPEERPESLDEVDEDDDDQETLDIVSDDVIINEEALKNGEVIQIEIPEEEEEIEEEE